MSSNKSSRLSSSLPKTFESPAAIKLMFIFCSIIIITYTLSVSSSVTKSLQVADTSIALDDFMIGEQKRQPKYLTSPGMEIVNNAYNLIYADFVTFCSSQKGKDRHIKSCMDSFIHADFKKPISSSSYFSSRKTASSSSAPWWFKTMIRDGHRQNSGLFGGWHFWSADNPPLDFCAIETLDTKKFKLLICQMNNKTTNDCSVHRRSQPASIATKSPLPLPIKATFVRDPLERFLSGFIDKCILESSRKNERHCGPNQVYAEDTESVDELFISDRKIFFEAYVNTLPLKWNLHFFPQSFYCNGGLFLEEYDFIATMGNDFYKQLYNFGQTFGKGNTLMESIDIIFNATENRNRANVGAERQEASLIEEHFNARTVKRLLEYFSIDYVLLNLAIPSWVDEILMQSNK